jgi:hypothetical protein
MLKAELNADKTPNISWIKLLFIENNTTTIKNEMLSHLTTFLSISMYGILCITIFSSKTILFYP